MEGKSCELLRLGGVRRFSQSVLRFSRHSAPFRGSAIVPTISYPFFPEPPKRCLPRIYEGIPQVDCFLTLSCSRRACADEFPMNSTKSSFTVIRRVRGRSFLRTPDSGAGNSPGRVPPDRSGALIHALGSLCTTTTCRLRSRGVGGLRRYSCASGRVIFAGSCK
jgi:hypothetical protein